MKHLLTFMLASLLLIGCSKDETTNPVETDSFITGSWITSVKISSGSDVDSLDVKLELTGKDGSISGNGEVVSGGKTGFTSYNYIIKDDATGSYSENEINVKVISSISGNSYNFIGTRQDKSGNTIKFVGIATLNLNSSPVVYDDLTLFKSN